MQRVLLLGLGLMLLLGIVVVMLVALVTAIAQADCGNGTPTTTVTAPGQSVQTMGEDTKYLESEGIPALAAAGIVGNLMQESGLNPMEPGHGLAQWNAGWWASASAWISAHGQTPNTSGGQLMYIAANVLDGVDAGMFYSGLRADLARASSAQQAALVWMNDYEQCSGAGPAGSLSFTPYSLCEAEQRESYAMQALQAAGGAKGGGGAALLTSLTPSAACNAVFPLTGSIKGYTNPFEKAAGIVWERTDQGVDAAMTPGSPLLAFAPSKVEFIVPNFYGGQPAIVSQVTAGPLAGKWWYWSEQIEPTVSQGQTVAAGQVVATYAPSGTGIEIGWWEANGGYPLGHPGYQEGLATNAGADFRYLLQALGANPGSGVGLSSGTTMGNSYYPTGNPGPGP
jgi:Phage tail lysozyme